MATDIKKCEYCGSEKTYVAVTKNGTPYPKWNSNPFKEDCQICGRCYKNLLYHKALPPSHVRRGIRIVRIAKRICHKCGGKTYTQKSASTGNDYHIWHGRPDIPNKWLCGKCNSNWLFEPKRKFKTKEARYQYISKIYTADRNKKVSEAVKKWAKTHQEHYYRIGILGAIKAREIGLSGRSTGLEKKLKKALRESKIRCMSQRRYGMGIMDFYLPEGNIALFADGGVWRADPRLYGPDDALFFKFKTSKRELKILTAKGVWRKDIIHNSYLTSKGYTVIRFWENEIKCKIEKCIKHIKKEI